MKKWRLLVAIKLIANRPGPVASLIKLFTLVTNNGTEAVFLVVCDPSVKRAVSDLDP
jgi:hypothetical protein